MKNLILILFVSFGVSILSQTTKKEDTTEICIPYKVGKQIMIDLNKLDSTSAILKLTKDEVVELNKKIEVQQSIIITMEEKIKTSEIIIQKTNDKFQIVDNINKDLTSDNRKLKRKNTIIQIISSAIIGGLTYGIIVK
jgi:alpha/beta superfamily hydrolase|tara:strand:- start:570 stop:983 length:414 start_codon:yes stop_codon:yes gene_type:complete